MFDFKSISTAGNQSNIDHHHRISSFRYSKKKKSNQNGIANISGWHTNPIITKLVRNSERGTMNKQCKNVLHQSFLFGFDIDCWPATFAFYTLTDIIFRWSRI